MNKWKIICLISVIVTVLIGFHSLNNEITVKKYQNEEYNQASMLSHNLQLNSKMMGLKINDIKCETKKDSSLLSNLVKNKPVFFYRYTASDCQSCIEKDLDLLYDFFEESDSTIINILCSYPTRRQYLIERSNIKIPLYNIEEGSLNLEIEDYETSFCFVLHPNMKISYIYIPNNIFPELTEQYLERV